MFYVLNFRDHSFKTCSDTYEVYEQVQKLLQIGVFSDEITVVNRSVDFGEFDLDAFLTEFNDCLVREEGESK